MKQDEIPREQVLDDMYDPNGGLVSLAARDYYYTYYATEEEKKEMDLEDKIIDVKSVIFITIFVVLIIMSLFTYDLIFYSLI